MSDRDIIFKMIMQLKQDIESLKARMDGMSAATPAAERYVPSKTNYLVESADAAEAGYEPVEEQTVQEVVPGEGEATHSLSINENKSELIAKALEKHHGNRKKAAEELGISERTLYRKIKEMGLQ